MSGSDGNSHGSGWSDVAKSFLRASQDDSDEAAKCEACRSETGSVNSGSDSNENEKDRSGKAFPPTRSWWAEMIRIHTNELGNPSKLPEEVAVMSACSGIFAEGEALKAGLARGSDLGCEQ